jgi:hypothetical protein
MVKLQWVCSCGQRHDAAAKFARQIDAGGRLPEAGDVLLCVGCGEPFAFQENADPVKLPWTGLVHLLRNTPERLRSFTMARALIRGMN